MFCCVIGLMLYIRTLAPTGPQKNDSSVCARHPAVPAKHLRSNLLKGERSHFLLETKKSHA